MAPARVLIVVENLSVPFDRRVWQEARALVEAGHEVTVICPRGAQQDREAHVRLEGVDIHRYPLRAATGGPGGFVREYGTALWRSLRLALRHGPFEVVHICNPPDLLFLVALPMRLRGARVVFDQHDVVPELYLSRFGRGRDLLFRALTGLEAVTYRLAHVVIATNESYRTIAISRGRKPEQAVFVVRSAPQLDRFQEATPHPALRQGAPHLLCYLGVMGPQDGVDYALRALASLRDEVGRADWHAAFVGSGDAFDEMTALSRRLGLENQVTFTGRIPDDELLRYLSTADVCLAPDPRNPLNDISTMNKVMEYMAMRRPIVSFDLRESRASAADAALYAPPNDEAEFARLIGRLLDAPDERRRMGAIGRARVEGELSWERSREQLLRAYDAALAPPRPASGRGASGGVPPGSRRLREKGEVVRALQDAVDGWSTGVAAPRVLEAGAGQRCNLRLPAAAHVLGVDVSDEGMARNRTLDERVVADIQHHPLGSDSFDLIVCWDVLEHLERPQLALARFATALRAGGLLVIKAPNLLSLKGLGTRFSPFWVHRWAYRRFVPQQTFEPWPTFLRRAMTPAGIQRYADANGLVIEYLGFYETDLQRRVRASARLEGVAWNAARRAGTLVSAGAADLAASDYGIVLRRPRAAA